MTQPSKTRALVTSRQWTFLRHTIRMGGSRSILRRRAVARHCSERVYGTITGWRFRINAAGRELFE